MSSSNLVLVILHPGEFQARAAKLQHTVQLIQQACQRIKLPVVVRIVPQLKSPHALFKELHPRITPKPTGIEEIDDWMEEPAQRKLTPHQVAHWFHHEVALRAPFEAPDANSPALRPDDIVWIMEDDTLFVDRSPDAIAKLLIKIVADRSWKILFTGACQLQESAADFLRPLAPQRPITSESVLFRVSKAKELIPHHEHIRFPYSGLLWWMARMYPEETYGLVTAATIDGSKFGLYPSTLSSASMPILNHDFRDLATAVKDRNSEKIRTTLNKLRKLQCANGLVPYIEYLVTEGKQDEAIEIAEEAFQWKSAQNGLLNEDCPLLRIILLHYRHENTKKIQTIRDRSDLPSKLANLKLAA